MRYNCMVCGYIYDESDGMEDNGIEPGTQFKDIDWSDAGCPLCGNSDADDWEVFE